MRGDRFGDRCVVEDAPVPEAAVSFQPRRSQRLRQAAAGREGRDAIGLVVYKVGEGRSVITAGKNRVTTILVPASKQKPADGATTTPAPATPAPASRPN